MRTRFHRTPSIHVCSVGLGLALTLSASACADLTISDRPRGSACEPGAAEACYSGDTATKDVGACRAGVHVCNADGTAFGACEGEVTPKAEDCATEADEDCNGKTYNDEAVGCACAPGTAKVCYSGPEATKDIGVCREGIALCDASGKAYGPCEDEIVPSVERCSLPAEDETCDAEPLCTGEPARAERFGSTQIQVARGIAASPDGAVLLAGLFHGSLKFGDTPLISIDVADAFVASLDAANNTLWSRSFGDELTQAAFSIARDADGNAVVMGEFANKINFGTEKSTELKALEGKDIYIAKLDAKDGHHLWSKAFPGKLDQTAGGVALDADGNTLFCGYFAGDINIQGPAADKLTADSGSVDMFFGKLDKNGVPVWSKRLGGASIDWCTDLAVDVGGNALVTGLTQGTIDIGGGNVLTTTGGNDVFIAKIKPDGSLDWAKLFGGGVEHQNAWAIAGDGEGNILVAGAYGSSVDFGGGPLPGTPAESNAFIVKLAPNGDHLWSKGFGGGQTDIALDAAVDAADNVLVTGYTTGNVDLGGGLRMGSGNTSDVFVLKLDKDGYHIWSAIYGGPGVDAGQALATDRLGGVIITGAFAGGPVTFGGDTLPNGGAEDIFLARLKP